MALILFNTLSRSLEEFIPLDPAGKKVGLYCCGPTVYDLAHIGNFRTFIFGDLVRRFLEFKGFELLHVMNITDVEDKIIKRVREENQPLAAFTRGKENAFWEDFDALGCWRPHRAPHATEHMPEIIALISRLLEKKMAYQAPDRSIYFSIEKYRAAGHRYGQLLNLNLDGLRAGKRVRSDEYAKESIGDFALWKARAPEDGAVSWTSPWGEGRPGWHIECSAMSMKMLGASFDLHLGGEDLIFPHHEDEIAQSEGADLQPPGRRFVRYWLHGAHLLVEGKKMSKSLGNFYTLRDLFQKGFTGREIRYLLLTAHYREPFNFTLEGLLAGRRALARLDEWFTQLRQQAGPASGTAPEQAVLTKFLQTMENDLNVSAAWGLIFEQVRETNRRLTQHALSSGEAAAILSAWTQIASVFGIELQQLAVFPAGGPAPAAPLGPEIPAEMLQLLEQRQAARQAKDYARADAIRNQLKEHGWAIEDTPQGARLKRI